MDKKKLYSDITLLPVSQNTLAGISSTDPTYTMIGDTPLGHYEDNMGTKVLPVFIGPDRNIVNLNSAQRFIKEGVMPVIPVDVPVCYRVDASAKGWWVSWTVSEFVEIFATPYGEDETATCINPCGLTRVYIDTKDGNSKELMDAVVTSREIFGDKLSIFVNGVYTTQTYEQWSDLKVEYVGFSDRFYPTEYILTKLKRVKLSRISEEKYCSAVVLGCQDIKSAGTYLALGADFLVMDKPFVDCLENGARFVGEFNWDGITHFRSSGNARFRYLCFLEDLDRFHIPGLEEYIKSLPNGKYSWPDYTPEKKGDNCVADYYDIDPTAVNDTVECPETGGYDDTDDGCCGDDEGNKFVCGCMNGEHCDECDCHPAPEDDEEDDPDFDEDPDDEEDETDTSNDGVLFPDGEDFDKGFGVIPESPDVNIPDNLDPNFGVYPDIQVPDNLDPGFTVHPEVKVPDDLDSDFLTDKDEETKYEGLTYDELVKFILLFDFRGADTDTVGITDTKGFWDMTYDMKRLFIKMFRPVKVIHKRRGKYTSIAIKRYANGELVEKKHPKLHKYINITETTKDILDSISRSIRGKMFFLGCADLHSFINIEHILFPDISFYDIDGDGVAEQYDYLYDSLRNKPSINGVTLIGDSSFPSLGLVPLDDDSVIEMFSGFDLDKDDEPETSPEEPEEETEENEKP